MERAEDMLLLHLLPQLRWAIMKVEGEVAIAAAEWAETGTADERKVVMTLDLRLPHLKPRLVDRALDLARLLLRRTIIEAEQRQAQAETTESTSTEATIIKARDTGEMSMLC